MCGVGTLSFLEILPRSCFLIAMQRSYISVRTHLDVFLPCNRARSWQHFLCLIMFLIMAIKFRFTGRTEKNILLPGTVIFGDFNSLCIRPSNSSIPIKVIDSRLRRHQKSIQLCIHQTMQDSAMCYGS